MKFNRKIKKITKIKKIKKIENVLLFISQILNLREGGNYVNKQ